MKDFRLLLVLILVSLGLLSAGRSYADADMTGVVPTHAGIMVIPSGFNDDIRNLPYYPYRSTAAGKPYRPLRRGHAASKVQTLSYMPDYASPAEPAAAMQAPVSFAGMSRTDSCTGGTCGSGWPPDTNGDVGPQHYIQAVNSGYAIYNKSGGLLASFTADNLWAGSGQSPCDGNSQGAPAVVYDPLGDRWILTHYAYPVDGSGNPVSPFYQCIAVSKTSDPVSGGWWLYAVRMDPGAAGYPPVGTLNDYPRFGIWPDCLYMAANELAEPSGVFAGTFVAAFSRTDLEAGRPLSWTGLFLPDSALYPEIDTMLPSNLLGASPGSLPPDGSPNYFVQESNRFWGFEVRTFGTSNNCGAGTFSTAPVLVDQPEYNMNFENVIPQSGTAIRLDALGDRLLQKAQYRKIGSAESLWVVHSVADGPPITRVMQEWAQIDVTGGTISTTPVQIQTYAPADTLYRWMGSLAVDNAGNMALGYSTSSAATFPGIAYSGRLATDPLSTLPQSETIMTAGGGSQIFLCGGVPCHHWGASSSMSVDPSDDCTFWYTNQYYDSGANGSTGNWQTRIGSFRFPFCDPSGLVEKVSDSTLSSTIGVALGALTGTDTLRLQSIVFYEDVTISSYTVTLDGGYNPGSGFTVSDGFTAAKSLTIDGGSAAAIVSALSLQ